jgi:hypothetical protein
VLPPPAARKYDGWGSTASRSAGARAGPRRMEGRQAGEAIEGILSRRGVRGEAARSMAFRAWRGGGARLLDCGTGSGRAGAGHGRSSAAATAGAGWHGRPCPRQTVLRWTTDTGHVTRWARIGLERRITKCLGGAAVGKARTRHGWSPEFGATLSFSAARRPPPPTATGRHGRATGLLQPACPILMATGEPARTTRRCGCQPGYSTVLGLRHAARSRSTRTLIARQ